MDIIINLFDKYGVKSLILLVIYILLNSNFTLQYPRNYKEKDRS